MGPTKLREGKSNQLVSFVFRNPLSTSPFYMNRHVKTAQKALSEIHLCLQKLCAEFFFSLKVIEYLEVQCHDHATGCI